ncbi:hypothetical protein [Streptomyces mirabilis]|uniref:hypothetical protein n=1 Tax=Streptomyces mirabilis TaxID=68239 RepID=UPI003626B374
MADTPGFGEETEQVICGKHWYFLAPYLSNEPARVTVPERGGSRGELTKTSPVRVIVSQRRILTEQEKHSEFYEDLPAPLHKEVVFIGEPRRLRFCTCQGRCTP